MAGLLLPGENGDPPSLRARRHAPHSRIDPKSLSDCPTSVSSRVRSSVIIIWVCSALPAVSRATSRRVTVTAAGAGAAAAGAGEVGEDAVYLVSDKSPHEVDVLGLAEPAARLRVRREGVLVSGPAQDAPTPVRH